MKLAMDEALGSRTIALDKKTVRRYDGDGRLHLEKSHISKANVCEYLGSEIPDAAELGLQLDKLYRLYRDPQEIAKAAATFNNIPILSRHVPVDARDHRPDLVIGSTGTDGGFADGFLDNSLVFWAGEAIDDIESEVKKELSSAYRYRADMTPGTTPEGEAYDGVMRDLVGNHVALVREGRAGPDVVVGDEAIDTNTTNGEVTMSKVRMQSLKATIAVGALVPFLKPLMAKDAKLDLGPVFAKVKPKTFGNMKGALVTEISKLTTGKLAKDAKLGADGNIEGLQAILDMVDGDKTVEDEDDDLMPEETMDAEGGGLKEFLKGNMTEDAFMKACDMMKPGGAEDEDKEETAEEKAEREKKEKDAKEKSAKDAEAEKEKAGKAMDAKINGAVTEAVKAERKLQNDIAAAREDVRPHVGALKGAFDSVDGVYQAALTVLGQEDADKITGVPALKALMQAKTAVASAPKPKPAMDAAATKSFAERFPGAARISVG